MRITDVQKYLADTAGVEGWFFPVDALLFGFFDEVQNARGIRGNNANWYVQDTYKVSSRLTLNAGVRYELPRPYTEIRNRQSLFEPGKKSHVLPNAPTGLVYPGDPGVPEGLIATDWKAFAPRVGVAWDPTGKGKLLITSAYGIFYEPYYTGQGGPLQTPVSAPPYLGTPQVSLPNFADPFNGHPPAPGTFSTPLTNLTLVSLKRNRFGAFLVVCLGETAADNSPLTDERKQVRRNVGAAILFGSPTLLAEVDVGADDTGKVRSV